MRCNLWSADASESARPLWIGKRRGAPASRTHSEGAFIAMLLVLSFLGGTLQAGPEEHATPLQSILTAVRRENPSIKAARARWEAMRLRVPQVRAWEDPMVGVDFERMGTTKLNTYTDAEWMISQQIPVSGKNRSRARAAAAEAKAGFEEYRRVELDVLSRARAAYFRLSNAYAQLAINTRNRELLGQFAEISRVKYESGTRAQSDLLAAETERLRLDETRANLERDVAAQESALNVLMGRPAGTSVARPEPLVFVPFEPARRGLEGFAAKNRPEVVMAARRVESAQAETELARRQWIPDPQLRLEARSYKDAGGGFQEYDTGIFFNVPWVNFRKYSAGVAEARKRVESARENLNGAYTEMSGLLRDQTTTIETSAKNYRLFRDNLLPLAQQAIEAARAGYESDKVGFLELITARRTLQDVEAAMTEHLANYRIALAELEAIAGGAGTP